MTSILALSKIISNSFPMRKGFKWFCTCSPVEVAPLMVNEVLKSLHIQNNQTVLDMTFGDGFHSEAILKSNETVNVIALDRDPHAIQKARVLSLKYPERIRPVLGRISDLPKLLNPLGIKKKSLDAICIDVGCSAIQLNDATRGFSSDVDGPLDMRMDGCETPDGISALDVLMTCSEHDLKRIFKIYGGEERGKKIAEAIVSCRYSLKSLQSTIEFRDFVMAMCNEKSRRTVKNVFYALRTFVNNEFNELNYAMLLAAEYLKEGGRLVSLTFHPLEDTIVKRHITGNILENNPNPVPLKYYSQSFNISSDEVNKLRSSHWSPLTKHVIKPAGKINSDDQRFQTAKLRAAIRS